MKVADILKIKGHALYTIASTQKAVDAVQDMAENDVGSLVVMDHGHFSGMLSFREVIGALAKNKGTLGKLLVHDVMNHHPQTCTLDTDIDQVRRLMLAHHARYMPVMNGATLEGVISFYDVAKAVVDGEKQENSQLRAYIYGAGVESSPIL